ncbi:GtrA family protein [Nocardioides sp.]|uniref:GtrA family protein n=1 Tax=Nocardioides sp. TaxID=35761 RepID=UPI00286E5A84|nr:GtrA family protein [Nocardioides sp.]
MSLPEVARRPASREVLTFLAVGGAGYVVDVTAFNLLRASSLLGGGDPLFARTLAVIIAMVVTYAGNRHFTWSHHSADGRRREVMLFTFFNLIGFALSAACLVISHHLLGLTGAWADNISANVIGVGLGTAFRFVTYRRIVFTSRPGPFVSQAPRVLIVSASMAAGHDGAAHELARRAEDAGYAVDRVDFLDLLPPGVGPLLRSAYWLQLRLAPATWGWLLPLLDSRGGRSLVGLTSRLARRRLLAACHPEPSLAISTYPLASHALSRLRLAGDFWSPVVTFLTDMSVHALWVAPGVDAHLSLHAVPAAQAQALGARGVEIVGPAVSSAFGPWTESERRDSRNRLGVSGRRPLALVVAGSWGVGDITHTVDDLIDCGLVLPVVVCGNNQQLLKSLEHREGVIALGWVSDMAGLMAACDVVVQNAGGLTSLEARQMGLPVVTYRSLPGHGLTNNKALHEAGWATWVHDREELSDCLRHVLAQPVTPATTGDIPWSRLVLDHTPVPT